jgi:ribosome-associated translation inhibitor RaiA
MNTVCDFFNFSAIADFHGHRIETFDPLAYFPRGSHWTLSDFVLWGHLGFDHRRAIATSAAGVDRLYRERDRNYMRMVGDFIDRFRDFDLIVMSNNFIHPELLVHELKRPIKILGFFDDPISTYLRGIQYLWAFDGAFYISPSYSERSLFHEALEKWGCMNHTWWPNVPLTFDRPEMSESFFAQRDIDVIYVGNPSRTKVDRLIRLKKHFGSRFRVHGRWPFKGYLGFVRGLLGKPVYPYRVTSLTTANRTQLYWRTKIGFNMHVSEIPMETGNMRMYEVPAHGAMQLCDKAARDAHVQIFAPDTEAVYYDSVEDAIEKIEYYLNHDKERRAIARAGCERFWADYEWEANLLRFLDWAVSVRREPDVAQDRHVMTRGSSAS